MKKILLSLAMLLVAHVASAQFVVGGQFGCAGYSGGETVFYESDGVTTEYTVPDDTEFGFLFAPKVGYQLSEKMQLGVTLNFTHQRMNMYGMFNDYLYRDPEFEGVWLVKENSLSIAPYLRYDLFNWGKLSAFVEAQALFGFVFKPTMYIRTVGTNPVVDTTFKVDSKTFDFGFVVVPGLNYKFNERLSMDLYFDLVSLGYMYRRTTEKEELEFGPEPTKDVVGNISTSSQFYFGANLSAQSISDHLGFCRLGFNFHF